MYKETDATSTDYDYEYNGKRYVETEEASEADIIVTNPPFSLMKEYIPMLMKSGKQFLVLGNMNHITFKEIFHYFIENKIWLGYTSGHFWFKVPEYYEEKKTDFRIGDDWEIYVGLLIWK